MTTKFKTGTEPSTLEEAREQQIRKQDQDRFHLDNLRLPQNYQDLVGVKKEILTIPVRKPNNQDYIRVRPGAENRLETYLLQLNEENETYVVSQNLWDELSAEIRVHILFTTINRQGVLTLWPIPLPDANGRHNPWHRSALEIAQKAEMDWVRVSSNRSLGAYEYQKAPAGLPEPAWPDLDFQQIVRIAFRDFFIETLDHAVIRRLRGLA